MLRLRRYERLLVENRRFFSNADQLTQNFRYKGSPPTNHSSSQKTRLNVLSYGIKIWTDLSTVLSQSTRVTDRRTDRIFLAVPRLHYMQSGKNGVSENFYHECTFGQGRTDQSEEVIRNRIQGFFWRILTFCNVPMWDMLSQFGWLISQ